MRPIGHGHRPVRRARLGRPMSPALERHVGPTAVRHADGRRGRHDRPGHGPRGRLGACPVPRAGVPCADTPASGRGPDRWTSTMPIRDWARSTKPLTFRDHLPVRRGPRPGGAPDTAASDGDPPAGATVAPNPGSSPTAATWRSWSRAGFTPANIDHRVPGSGSPPHREVDDRADRFRHGRR